MSAGQGSDHGRHCFGEGEVVTDYAQHAGEGCAVVRCRGGALLRRCAAIREQCSQHRFRQKRAPGREPPLSAGVYSELPHLGPSGGDAMPDT
jgi:hypothetical protein